MKKLKLYLAVFMVAVLGMVSTADVITGVLKGAAIVLLVNQFGKDMNKGINKITNTENETEEYKTKVVPIISVGQGAYVGAAQVMGPPDQVDKVKAVAQLEADFFKKGVRLKALVPVATNKPTSEVERVTGVGVSGIIDIKL